MRTPTMSGSGSRMRPSAACPRTHWRLAATASSTTPSFGSRRTVRSNDCDGHGARFRAQLAGAPSPAREHTARAPPGCRRIAGLTPCLSRRHRPHVTQPRAEFPVASMASRVPVQNTDEAAIGDLHVEPSPQQMDDPVEPARPTRCATRRRARPIAGRTAHGLRPGRRTSGGGGGPTRITDTARLYSSATTAPRSSVRCTALIGVVPPTAAASVHRGTARPASV